MKDTLCIGGGPSHHQFGVNLVGFHAIIFTVYRISLVHLTEVAAVKTHLCYNNAVFLSVITYTCLP